MQMRWLRTPVRLSSAGLWVDPPEGTVDVPVRLQRVAQAQRCSQPLAPV